MTKMVRNFLLVMASLLTFSAVFAETARDPYTHFFNETFGDFSEELENAREQGKQGVMIFFEMDECPFCHWMKQNVLSDPAVQAYYREQFLLFTVDIEGDVEIVNFQGVSMSQKDFSFKENRVRATPVIAFFDLDGKPIHRHTGRTSDTEEFMLMGKFVAEGHHEKTRFTRFKREQRQ